MTKLIAQYKPILWLVLVAFLFNTLMPPPAEADVSFLPAPGKLVSLTPSFSPPLIRGLKVFKKNPFKFEFIMSEGDTTPGEDSAENAAAKQVFLKEEGNKLVKYFLASLTVPAKDMWVNLSPYERNRIIPTEFGITEMGKEVLAQDYLLKQVTASVMYPEGDVGREFWRLIYQEAYKRFGTTNISVNTFNKVWIVPETAVVYENAVDNTAVIVESRLNVMLEEDYLALDKSALNDSKKVALAPDRQLSNELIRQVILPLLKKEVNTGKNFAVLRQVYSSLILALWYKNKLKQSLISQGYVDRKKTNGVEVSDKNVDQEIYRQYLKSYKKGVYNYIKEEIGPTNEVIPRKYFSGGVTLGDAAQIVKVESGPDSAMLAKQLLNKLKMYALAVGVSAFTKGPESEPTETSIDLTDLEASASKTEPAQPATLNLKGELEIVQQSEQLEEKLTAFNKILAGIVNGGLDLSDPQVLSPVVNSILELHQTGNGALIRERIMAYQKLLELPNRFNTVLSPQQNAVETELGKVRASLTEQQQQTMVDLLAIMHEEYLTLEPWEAINDLNILPVKIESDPNTSIETENDVAKRVAAAREGIQNTLEHLSWDSDTLFSRKSVSLKIIEGNAVKYDEVSGKIEIGEDTLSLDQNAFAARLQKEFRKALLHRTAQDLGKILGIDRDTQDLLEGKMASIAGRGTSLSEFILFCNMSDGLSVKKVNDFLDLVFAQGELGYDKVEQYIGLKRHVEGRTRNEALEAAAESHWNFLKPVVNFLREHPAVAIIPIAIIAAAGSLHAADLNHIGGTAQAGPDMGPIHQPLVLNHVLHLGSRGAEVTDIGTVLIDHVTPADIQNLTGNNPITGRPYDSQYFSQNAGRIFRDAKISIQQGVFNTAVQDAVVAYEKAHGLAEDGSIGRRVFNTLNSSGPLAGDTVSGLFGNSPEVTSILSSLNPPQKTTVGGTSGHAPGTAADFIKQGGPINGPQPVVNSGAVYVGQLNQQILKAQDDITAASQALQDNLNEQQTLRDQIQTPAGAGGGTPPDDIAAQQMELVREYHLSVPNLPPVPLPYQSPGAAPPIAQFQPDAVGIAWIDYQINQIQKDHPEVKNLSPIKGIELLSNNRDYVSLPIGGGQATFNIEPDLPFRSLLSLSQMGKGFANFGAQSTLNQVAGPLFASQIMLNLRNEIETHKLRGQDVRYDARMKNHASGIVQTLTVHVVPIRSFDQKGNVVEEHLYSVGLVDTIQAALGKLDNVLGGKGIIGDNRNHFVTSNLGYQIKVNDYHQAFTHAARFNKDLNASFIDVYNINDAGTRYRKNKHNGWENVAPSTPLDPRLDYYSATVNGFILHVDPATGKITGQRAYTAATFVTGAYAKKLTQENGTKIAGNSYLDPKSTFMERVSSIDDLKQEKILTRGVDAQGRIIWGVLRDPVTGRIKEFITDPLRLNEISRIKDEQGRTVIRFVPGTAYQAPSGVGNFLKDYTADEFKRVLGEYGLLHANPQNSLNNSAEILSKRPQLTQVPPGLESLFQNKAFIFNPSIALNAINQAAKDHYGMIYFVDGQIPAVLTSMDHVKTLGSLDKSNGVLKVSDGVYTLAGSDFNLDGKTLVFLDEQGKVTGIIDPSDKLRQERINNLDIENQRITLWQEGLANYGVAIDSSDNLRPLLTPANEFIPARYAGSGVVGQKFGVKQVVISGNMLVKVVNRDGQNTIVEILQAGQKTMALWKQGMENYGVAIDQNNNVRPLMTPANEFTPARFAGNGVIGQTFGAQKTVVISGDMLVRVIKQDGQNIVAEIMESGQKTVGLWNQGMENYGVAIDQHNNLRPLLAPTDEFIPAKYAGTGVVGQVFGDNQVIIGGDVMVRFVKVDGRNIVVEILEPGKKTIADHQAVLATLAQGSIEALDQRSVDPRTGNYKVVYFARGNKLTPEQKALNFHPEKELVELVLKGQATTVMAQGTNGKRRWVILNKAPASTLREMLQGHHPQPQGLKASTPAQTLKISTLLGPDSKTFHGVTVTTEVFSEANIPELNSINATAIRTYYPIPADLVREIMAKTKVRTFIVGIPFNSFAYNTENLSNYWGKPVPLEGQRISLQANNYLPYLEQLRKSVGPGAEIVVDLGNELNLHTAWLGKPDNQESRREIFSDINRRALEIKGVLPNVKTTFTLGDREEDFTLALQSAPAIDVWGVNYYRHNKTLADTVQKATQATGVHRPFYIAEMGIDSTVGDSRQASIVTQDLQIAREMGISNVLMTLQDDPNKKGSEAFWGLYDKQGKPKQVVMQMESGQVGPRGVSAGTLAELSKNSFVVTLKDRKGSVYVSLDQLKDPEIYDMIRQEASEVTMVGANQEVTARVYLSKNIYGSRIEVMQANHTSLVFELPSFSPANLANPVAKTSSFTDPKTGLLHVITTDLRPVNAGVIVEDVYQTVNNAAPVKIYSDRYLQQERIYFKNGHEEYSVSLNTASEPGQTVMINGTNVEHVTGIYRFEGENNTGSGYYIGLRNIEKNGWFAPIRLSTFTDGQITLDQTGFVKIEPGLNDNEIIQRTKNSGVLNMKDEYTYQGNGQFDSRKISFLVNGSWQTGWALKGSDIAPQGAMVEQLLKNDVIAQAFARNKINKDTVFTKTLKTTSDGGITEDYRVAGDVLEKKVITVIKQDGVVVKTIVGLEFNAQTGEQVFSYNLTPDGQVQSFSRTVPNNSPFMKLLPPGIAEQYAQYMKEHMNVSNADLGADLSGAGVSTGFVPVMIEETPFMIQTDNPKEKGYKFIEPQIRPLIKAYMAADARARPGILEQISDILRDYHRGSNSAHYTNVQGQPTYHYLAPPNDSRGRDFITKMSNGDLILDLWWLEGTGTFKTNILPGSIVLDSSGKLKRTMVFDHDADMVFKNAQGEPHTLRVNAYNVYHDQSLTKVSFTSLGQRVSETSRYVRNRVANGAIGVQTKGEETINYDPMSPYAMPILGTLGDGQLTKVDLHLEYSAVNGRQQIVETAAVNEPTAPGDFKVKTQTIVEGKPVVGSLHQEETLKGYVKNVIENWRLYFIYPGMLLGLFITGDFIKRKRLARIKKELAELEQNTAVEQTGELSPVRELVYPANWNTEKGPNAYGFSQHAVGIAKERFEGTIIPMLKKAPLEDVLNEYFRGYKIWRKQIMGLDGPYVPSIEDLWVMFLRDADNDIFGADVPDGLNYLMHKAIEAREKSEEDADIGGFIKKEYTRWHHIIELQQTTFQGMSGGTMRNVVPYDYYITVEDLNDRFRTKGFIEWYDNLGYSLDGKQDARGAIYDDFISTLEKKVSAAKAGIGAMAGNVGNNVFKMKRELTKVPAYKEYVDFFLNVQKGEYQVSDQFGSPDISQENANRLIDQKPLIGKTFSESGSWVGKMPLPMRLIKPVAQFVRNNYNQLTYPVILSSTVGLFVAAFDGLMTWGAATMTAAVGLVIIKALYYPLSYLLDNKVNTGSFGKPKDFWAGYDKEKLTTAQKWYRGSFWSIVISAKVAWDAFLLHNFLIPFRETLGANYFPVIAGHQIPIDFNLLLMGMLFSTSAIFLFVSSFAATYLTKPFFTFTHGAIRGLGTIKTAEDIRRLEEDQTLDRLIEQKLLPHAGAGLTDEQRANARKAIIKYVFDQHRNIRDEVGDEEYRIAIEQGRFDHIKIPEVQKNIAQAVNALIMDMPQMPTPDEDTPLTVVTPVYGEDLIYAYNDIKESRVIAKSGLAGLGDGRILRELIEQGVLKEISDTQVKINPNLDLKRNEVQNIAGEDADKVWEILQKVNLPTALDMMLNNGYTNLNFIISKAPQRWENLIERVQREGMASEDELNRMQYLAHNKGQLGEINEALKMQIRLWASYEGQPFARTLDGLMNIVRWHQLFLKISFPDWTDQQIQERTNKDVQIIWGYQIWGDILKATDDQPDNLLKKQDVLYLMKKYYDELGFLIDIASLQVREGVSVKVLSRYNPQSKTDDPISEQIKDVWAVPMTKYKAIPLEGKPGNQMHAMSFARNKFRFTIDVNQDLDPLEAIKIPIVIQEFKNPNVGIVNVPETIFTSTFSRIGDLHAFSDRTFVTSDKRHMGMVSSPSHHGHPDVWKDTDITEHGGVSSTVAISEDYKGGIRLILRGITILNREYMQWKKGRELSWAGTDGIWRKFAMGGAQLLLGRYAHWMNRYFGPIAGAGEFYSGPHFYTLNTIAALGFFIYTINVMISGISPFTAFPAPFVSMMAGVLWVGQAITVIGITQMVLEEGIKKGLEKFFKLLPFIIPFYVAHIFTLQAGFLSGLAGLAAYVATGRGFNRENLGIDKILKAFSKSHVIVGTIGLALTAYAFDLWRNETFMLSLPIPLSYFFAMVMPFITDPGNYPIHGVTVAKSAQHFKSKVKEGLKFIKNNFWSEGLGKGNYIKAIKEKGLTQGFKEAWARTDLRKSLVDTVIYSITYGVWFSITAPVAIEAVKGKSNKPIEIAGNVEVAGSVGVDKAMTVSGPGGIDLGKTMVSVEAPMGKIQTAFDDPAMLRLLLNADGLAPIIYNIKTMTPSMVDHFVGVDQ